MAFHASITKREMNRKLSSGETVTHSRYVLHYRDPQTGKRTQRFFEKMRDAQAAQSELLVDVDKGTFFNKHHAPTVAEAFDHWFRDRQGQIKGSTENGYQRYRPYIVGPLLDGTAKDRYDYSRTGKLTKNAMFLPMLGEIKINDLTTAQIRAWFRLVQEKVGNHSANKSRLILSTILALAAEDFGVRPPAMPKRIGRGNPKEKKKILSREEISKLIAYAKTDRDYGLYYVFGFLMGTRPSEQLGLLWEDIDFEKRVIHICRMQERDGSITNFTKTTAGTRVVPMSQLLYEMLMDWKLRCPHREGQPHRVFPNLGFLSAWPEPRKHGGGPLLYANFRKRVWIPGLRKAGVQYTTPHAARHAFISLLQERGVEVALVSKLAGHANPSITLAVYSHATRGGEEAVEELSRAFSPAV